MTRAARGHPVEDIHATEAAGYLEGKCIALGVTGSIAAYRSIDAARWLVRRGARVKPVLTTEAERLVGRDMWHWATGEQPVVELSGETEHIELARQCDSMLVAPATLSTMAKIAYGVVDNPVALTAVSLAGYGKPLIIVPAMHWNMYTSTQYKSIEEKLQAQGATIVPPMESEYAAKYPDPHTIARITAALTLRGQDLKGKRILVTAGPTREWIDRVRYITNPSSGRMGVEIALEAWARGATVDLVHGPLQVEPPHMVNLHPTETTREMAERIRELTSRHEYDALIAAAAPADYTPVERAEGKIRSGQHLTLNLKPTPKVIASHARRPRVLVAFAAEVAGTLRELEELTLEKKAKTGSDIIVGNMVGVEGSGFKSAWDTVVVIDGDRLVFKGRIHKESLARIILDIVSKHLPT